MDRSMRFYLVVKIACGVVTLLERGNAGPDEIRRKNNEADCVAVRHIDEETFERLFTIVTNVGGGELVHRWTDAHNWSVTAEAREIINRVIWFEDTIEFLKSRAARRQAKRDAKKVKAYPKAFSFSKGRTA